MDDDFFIVMNTISDKKPPSLLTQYGRILNEIRLRWDFLNKLIGGQKILPPLPTFELAHLELRKMCELIALGCLTAHGDIPGIKSKLYKEYNASDIINKLTRLHPDFYPQVLKPYNSSDPQHRSGILTKDDLIELYNKDCADVLHRGTMKKLEKRWDLEVDFSRI